MALFMSDALPWPCIQSGRENEKSKVRGSIGLSQFASDAMLRLWAKGRLADLQRRGEECVRWCAQGGAAPLWESMATAHALKARGPGVQTQSIGPIENEKAESALTPPRFASPVRG